MPISVGFDPVAGSLRLSRRLLADLRAAYLGEELPFSSSDQMSSAGLFKGGALHPRLVPVAEVASRPLVRLKLEVLGRTPLDCDGWVGESYALILVGRSADEEVFEATFLSRSLLTSQLARFIELGPRERAKTSDPVEMDRGLLEAVLGGGEPLSPSQLEMLLGPHDEIIPSWLEVLSALSAGLRTRWRIGVWWNSFEESPQARVLEILDSEAGVFLVGRAARRGRRYPRAFLRPVTPTQVWRLLCALVPAASAVAEPLQA